MFGWERYELRENLWFPFHSPSCPELTNVFNFRETWCKGSVDALLPGQERKRGGGQRRKEGVPLGSWSVRGPAVALRFTGERAPTPQQPTCRPQPGTLPEPSLSPQRARSLQEPPLPHGSPGKHHSWLALWPGRKRNRCPRSQLFSDTWARTLTEHAHIHSARIPPVCRLTRARTDVTLRHTLECRTLPCAQAHAHTSHTSTCAACMCVSIRGACLLPHSLGAQPPQSLSPALEPRL